jgi:2-oxoglutarate dehydrogenase E2 component (dihydrolipoamide succinyltransferase)
MAKKILVPEMGESVVEATVGRWLKKEGDRVAVGDVVVELETDKANLEVGAEHAGVLGRIEKDAGEDVAVGDLLAVIEESEERGAGDAGGEEAVESEEAAEPEPPRKREETSPPVKASPSARRLAREHGIDLSEVRASGGDGRISRGDVESHLEGRAPSVGARPSAAEERADEGVEDEGVAAEEVAPSTGEGPAEEGERREERIRMTRRRQTIARRMVEAQATAAILTTFNEVDMKGVMDLRRRRQEAFVEKHGVKLGIVSFFVKASIAALKAFPELNAEIDDREIVLKHYYDIGIAVGAEGGLVVPVLRDADRMSFGSIERTIKEFGDRAAEGKLSLEDLRGGTFTISNGGVFGSLLSTPILNPPQVGILGLHAIQDRPVVRDGEVVVRPMMYVALSYDHRIVDGREAVRFLVRIKELVEDPSALLLEG